MNTPKHPFWWLVLSALLLNILAQALHEGGHLLVYSLAGHSPVWRFTGLVQRWEATPPPHPATWIESTAPDGSRGWLKMASKPAKLIDEIGTAAGPLASLFSTIAGWLIFRYGRKPATRSMGLLLAIITSFMMGGYYARSGMRAGGDEGFLANLMGVPKITLDLPMGLAFLACFILALVALKDWKTCLTWFGACLLGMIPSAALMVLLDPIIQNGVEQGNPWFAPVLGFSLPVLVTYLLMLVGLFFVHRLVNHSVT